MSEKNKEIIEKVNAAFAENNMEAFLSLCADNVEWGMVGDKSFKGKQAIRDFMSAHGEDAPEFTVERMIAEGDSVVCYGDMTMKGEGGESFPYSYCDVYQFKNDEIVRLQSFIVKHKTESENEQTAAA